MKAVDFVLRELEYDRSPNYLPIGELASDPDHGFLYRKAQHECHVEGAYLLRGREQPTGQADVPVVYICHVDSEQEARRVHRRVWNQNLVPFLIVISSQRVRLYSGFQYEGGSDSNADAGALRVLTDFNREAEQLSAFRARDIDNGELWRVWGSEVRVERRVDWRLLANLRGLEKELASSGLDDQSLIHSVIGKFVYLRYLRDRQILSDRKLHGWRLDEASTLSRQADPEAFCQLMDHLDEWLNGSVFPLTRGQVTHLGVERLRHVAGIFRGDLATGQMALEFANYNFSFIPIETLSVIYEQFLHAPDESSLEPTRGREQGAYYTPVPVVNYMIDGLIRKSPLRPGMRILDPACGSGVFLVQCYRRLIEGQVARKPPSPLDARQILTESIFGIDTDLDACQIAELSLILTLLDYVKPPDLEAPRLRRFLPKLRERNILHGNAFNDDLIDTVSGGKGFDWVLGNPPWKELRSDRKEDEIARHWAAGHHKEYPIGGRQEAELFAWRSFQLLSTQGVAGLLLPAMTLFKSESMRFRQQFFGRAEVWSVANFANLANVLFGGRSTVPAMAVFFSHPSPNSEADRIEVFAPFLANQPTLRNGGSKKRRESWNLLVNASEIKELGYSEALRGDSLTWKIATWGSFLDRHLLERLSHRTLSSLEDDNLIVISEGLQTRRGSAQEPLEHHPELAGRKRVAVAPLRRQWHLFRFPNSAIELVPDQETYVRKGRFRLPYRVSQSPHIIVSASRSFAVYDEESLLIPPRQIGIAAERARPELLRALALYLNSDFALYHQFFTTPEAGIQKTRNTLESLRSLPIPFAEAVAIDEWEELFEHLRARTKGRYDFDDRDLVHDLNDLTARSLGLNDAERALVEEFVDVRLRLTRGKVPDSVIGRPGPQELDAYGVTLRAELDGFIDEEMRARHRIVIAGGVQTGIVEVRLIRDASAPQPVTFSTSQADFDREYALAQKHLAAADSQWVYFRRDLRIYAGSSTYLLKPFERLHWTRTQAMLDAAELLAEMVTAETETETNRA